MYWRLERVLFVATMTSRDVQRPFQRGKVTRFKESRRSSKRKVRKYGKEGLFKGLGSILILEGVGGLGGWEDLLCRNRDLSPCEAPSMEKGLNWKAGPKGRCRILSL